MARPIPRDTTVVRVDENGTVIHKMDYFSEADGGIFNVIRPNGTTTYEDSAGLFFGANYTEVKLYDSGNVFTEITHKGADFIKLTYSDKPKPFFNTATGKFYDVPQLVNAYEFKDGQYVDERVYSGDQLASRHVTSFTNSFRLNATFDGSNFRIELDRHNGNDIVSTGGGNINKLVAQGAGNLISNDGGSLVAQGGGNLVAQGGGNLQMDVIRSVISNDGASLIRDVFNLHRAKLISNDGASVITQDGGSLIAQGGGNLIGEKGYGLLDFETNGRIGAPMTTVDPPDDFANSASTSGTVAVNGFATGNLEVLGDRDWFSANLTAGTAYTIEIKGASSGDGSLIDPVLWLYNNSINGSTGQPGVLLTSDDENGTGHNARIIHTASYTGVHYFEARSYTVDHDANASTPELSVSSGSYRLTLATANTNPFITSASSKSVAEYQTEVMQVTGNDAVTGASGLKYYISGGADGSKFGINELNGVLFFNIAPDYERPTDANANIPAEANIYEVDVKVVDQQGLSATQSIDVIVTDVAEPEFFTHAGADVYSFAKQENNDSVDLVEAFEAGGAGSSLTYTLLGEDAARFYYSVGEHRLYFNTAPDYENPRDVGHNNIYTVDVRATNPSTGRFDTVTYNVTITDGPDPAVTSVSSGQAMGDNAVKNPFASSTIVNSNFVQVSLSTTANGTFTPASLSGWTTAGSGIYTKSGNATDLTNALRTLVFNPDDNEVAVGSSVSTTFNLLVRDAANLTGSASSLLIINSINDAPTITSNGGGSNATVNVAENTAAVTTVQATDPDIGATRTYSLISAEEYASPDYDVSDFSIDSSGALRFISAPDYEAPQGTFGNTYIVGVRVSDGFSNDDQFLFVNVTDVADGGVPNPTISNVPASYALNDNGVANPFANPSGSATVSNATSLKVTISNTANGTFAPGSLDGWTATGTPGQWTFSGSTASMSGALRQLIFDPTNNQVAPSAEVTTTFDVEARDAANHVATASTSLVVTSVNDAPTGITAGTLAVNELAANSTLVGTVTAQDPDVGGGFTYSLSSNPGGRFTINNSGEIRVANGLLLDFEQQASWNIAVHVVDNGGKPVAADPVFAVTVKNVDPEVITGDGNPNTFRGGTQNDQFFGMGGIDNLGGNGGNDRLDGGAAADIMAGGFGNDQFFVDNAGDVVNDAAGEGNDRVFAGVNYTLAAGQSIETLSTTSDTGTGAINLTGNEIVNVLIGNDGVNRLDGRGAADVMAGYGGDDWYFVDVAGDKVVWEGASDGTDRVFAGVSYTLAATQRIETLSTTSDTGTGAINLTGNEFVNVLIGNDGVNRLDGRGAADVMAGYGGDDWYFVDVAGDKVVWEGASDGTDRVFAGVSYTLAATQRIETLSTLSDVSTTAINLTGNEFANTLIGNDGVNRLDGRGAADVMAGYGGDDWYFVDVAGDKVAWEGASDGIDRVFAGVSYTLAATQRIETLSTLSEVSTSAINLTGNEFANTLIANAGANVLNGGAGADVLASYGGNDIFLFNTAIGPSNIDTLYDFVVANDTVHLENAIFTQLTTPSGNTLSAAQFFTGAAAHDADDRIIYNSGTGALFYDSDGDGAAAAIQFAKAGTGLGLTNADFFVV